MTQSVAFLNWIDQPGNNEPVAIVNCDFATDLSWVVGTNGSYKLGRQLEARYVALDNGANGQVVRIEIGAITYPVDQYSRKTLYIPPNSNQVSVTGVSGIVQLQFLIFNRNPNFDGANDFAINQAIAAQLASQVGQTVGPIINPSPDVWPQGAGPFASINMQYGPEGHMTTRNGVGGNIQLSRQTGTLGTFAAKVQRIAGDASLATIYAGTQCMSADSKPFAGKQVTFSVSINAGANFSAAGGVLTLAIINGIGNDQNMFSGGFTGANVVASQNVVLTSGVQRFSVSGLVPSNATQLGFQLYYTPTGVAGADDSFTWQQMQLDVGTSAQAYRPVPLAVELERCAYFFERKFNQGINTSCGMSQNKGASSGIWNLRYAMKRVTPTITVSGGTHFKVQDATASNSDPMATITPTFISLDQTYTDFTTSGGLLGAGSAGSVLGNNANCFVDVNARM